MFISIGKRVVHTSITKYQHETRYLLKISLDALKQVNSGHFLSSRTLLTQLPTLQSARQPENCDTH